MTHCRGDNADAPADLTRSWVWSQQWIDLLFLHWRVPFVALRSLVPDELEIDIHDGDAWVSLVLFRLRVRPRWLPFVPGFSDLVEINLRTYIRCGAKPSIWFLSVHADNSWAIRVAKWLTPMPYQGAVIHNERSGRRFHFESSCRPNSRLDLAVTFCPGEPDKAALPDTLDKWLLERYRLFAQDRRRNLVHAQVSHPQWVTRGVDVTVAANRLGRPFGLDLARPPDRTHFSDGVGARFGAFSQWTDESRGCDERSGNNVVRHVDGHYSPVDAPK